MPAAATVRSPSDLIIAPLDAIDHGDNYRKTYDQAYLDGLAASIKAKGVIQPIVVRPAPKGSAKKWLLVAGECRCRASKAAGLTTIPAVLREDLDEASAREISIIENLQRRDVDPLEEADGFRELHEKHGRSVDQIAEAVGQKRGYVYARLKLCSLAPEGRKAYAEGVIDVSVAVLIARIPSKDLQAQAIQELGRWGRVRYDDAARLVHERYMLRLQQATFDTTDDKLVPAAGSCAACPKRTGNQRELFADVKSGDVCTDPICYRAKLDAAWAQTAAKAEAKGQVIVDDKRAAKLFPYGDRLSHDAPFVDLDAECYLDEKGRKYKSLIAKGTQIHLARDSRGMAHQLVAKEDLAAAMKGSGVKLSPSTTLDSGDAARAAQSKEQAKAKRKHAVVRATIAEVVGRCQVGEKLWRVILDELSSQGYANAISDVVKRRGWGKKGERAGSAFDREVEGLAAADLPGLALEVIISRNAYFAYHSGMPDGVVAAAKTFGVDIKKIEKRVAEDEKAKAKEKPKAKAAKKGGAR